MILDYAPEYVGQIVEKVIGIISDERVSVVKEINSTTNTDYYVFIHDNPDWCLQIFWVTYTDNENSGFIKFNYECPDMAPLPNMPEMLLGRYLTNTRPAIHIEQDYPLVKKLIRKLNQKAMAQIKQNASVQKIRNTICSFLRGGSKKR